jgi:hypothetical protein
MTKLYFAALITLHVPLHRKKHTCDGETIKRSFLLQPSSSFIMSTAAEVYDHTGAAVKHGRARVNGIRQHYITAGQGSALLLLHGT